MVLISTIIGTAIFAATGWIVGGKALYTILYGLLGTGTGHLFGEFVDALVNGNQQELNGALNQLVLEAFAHWASEQDALTLLEMEVVIGGWIVVGFATAGAADAARFAGGMLAAASLTAVLVTEYVQGLSAYNNSPD